MAASLERPRLLFVCHTLPYPPDGGPWIRTYHVLRLLADTFDVTAGPEGLGRFASVEVYPIPQRHNRIRCAWDHARSLLGGRVYTTYMFRSAAVHKRLRELL